jgi:hypothetical protein
MRLRKGDTLRTEFPTRQWSSTRSMEKNTVESRQVLLNEFMREICRKELPPETEDLLFHLLRIGKYEKDD